MSFRNNGSRETTGWGVVKREGVPCDCLYLYYTNVV
jgi:hypothetical protein